MVDRRIDVPFTVLPMVALIIARVLDCNFFYHGVMNYIALTLKVTNKMLLVFLTSIKLWGLTKTFSVYTTMYTFFTYVTSETFVFLHETFIFLVNFEDFANSICSSFSLKFNNTSDESFYTSPNIRSGTD